MEEGQDEKHWAQSGGFMDGCKKHVGKLGTLLGEYEEKREVERIRAIRAAEREFIPEEDSDSDGDMDYFEVDEEELEPEEARMSFERLVREQFIYGLLDVGIRHFLYTLFKSNGLFAQSLDYDKVDWDEQLDVDNDRETENDWFDDEDEG